MAECLQRQGGDESQCVEHHPHYMWVPIFTLAQAAISYLPHYLWHYWEGEELYRDFCVFSLQETDNYLSSLDEKMRKMLGNLKEKRFYNENKTERKRQSPNSLKIYKKSGEAVRLTEILRNFVM